LLIGVRPILISLTLPLIILSVDVLTWPRYILSDMINAFLIVVTIYFIIKGLVKKKICYLELLLIIFFLLASRPTSVPIVFTIILFVIISKYEDLLEPKKVMQILIAFFFFIPLLFGSIYFIIVNNFSGIDKLDYLINMVKVGMIIHDRPDTWVDNPSNFFDVTYIYFLRIINFFNPYASTFSIIHIFLNMVQFFSVIISILFWFLFGFNTKNQNKIFVFILIMSFFVSAFHSFTIIDYDWRYRFPIILPLLMLFPISLSMFLKKK